jgi:hypothetical protein
MTASMGRVILTAALALALGCEGPPGEAGPTGSTGRQGPTGAEGPSGPGFDVGRSISGLQPNWVAQGRVVEVQISGYATDWAQGAAPEVNFGEGLTVTEVSVASNSALLVRVTAEPGAQAGKRNITVTSGGETLTFAAGFEVRRLLEATVLGELVRPSLATIRVQNNDAEWALPTPGAAYSVSLPPGLQGAVFNVTADVVLISVLATLESPLGTANAVIRVHPGTALERTVTVPVTVTQSEVPAASGATHSGTVTAYASSVFRFVAASSEEMVLGLSSAAGFRPGAYVFSEEADALIAGPGDTFDAVAGEAYFGIVYALGGGSGAFTALVSPVLAFTETEPNDSVATASSASGVVFDWNGDVSSADLVDYVRVDAGVNVAGRSVHVQHTGGGDDADFTVEILSADGAVSHGVSPNLYLGGSHLFEPMGGGTTYLMKVSYGGFPGGTGIRVSLR